MTNLISDRDDANRLDGMLSTTVVEYFLSSYFSFHSLISWRKHICEPTRAQTAHTPSLLLSLSLSLSLPHTHTLTHGLLVPRINILH